MKFNQRRLRFKLSGLPSGVEYKVRCYAYHDDTPDEIGESTTSFKIESPPEGGKVYCFCFICICENFSP